LRAFTICALVTVTTVGVGLVAIGQDAVPAHRDATTYTRRPGVRALAVLHEWDRRRASAWASGDVESLARLYVVGSRTGARDARELRRWREHGLRAVGLHVQVSAAQVRHRSASGLTLVVTDRTVDGVATGGPYRVGLPRSAWATHRITLRRVRDAWRVAEVRTQPAR